MLSLGLIVQPWGDFEGFESGQWSRAFALIECRGLTEEVRDWNALPTAEVQVTEDTGLKWGRNRWRQGADHRREWKVLQDSGRNWMGQEQKW